MANHKNERNKPIKVKRTQSNSRQVCDGGGRTAETKIMNNELGIMGTNPDS